MKLEHNLLIQGLIELKWMSKEAVPLLSTKMYEAEQSTVGKLRAHGLTSEAIFEAAIYANQRADDPLPVVDLALMTPLRMFDEAMLATTEELLAQFVVPILQLGDRLIMATADPSNAQFFDTLALRSRKPIEYWIAESDAIRAALLALNLAQEAPLAASVARPESAQKTDVMTSAFAKIEPVMSASEQQASSENLKGVDQSNHRIEPTLSGASLDIAPLDTVSLDGASLDTASFDGAPLDAKMQSVDQAPDHNRAEIVVTSEYVEEYLDEEVVRDVDVDSDLDADLDQVDERDPDERQVEDSSDRFALLQDSALDVDEWESKPENAVTTELAMAASYLENEEMAGAENITSAEEPTLSQDDPALERLEVLDDLASKSLYDLPHSEAETLADRAIMAEPDDGHEAVLAEPRMDGVTADMNAATQSSAMMLREVLAAVGSKEQGQPLEEEGDIIEYLNYILLDAITQKASDIHFEPYESSYRIRFRIDGVLHKVYVVPEQYRPMIAARLKVMAELDIAEKRLPQDGHITICLGDEQDDEVDARISVMPTLWGEKVVIRLLDRSEMSISLRKLGLSESQKYQLQSAIERSQGLVLVTGPTGSGKTVTLYACLNHLNDASRNIATVEDPIEINLEGINQLQVHPKIGLDFSEALRAFLRQDPDVLMVGEIRDYETADMTIKAAQTGHLVLSTLHTNSAVESLLRLQNMGIETYNTASTVKLIVAQRLVRELCHCKEEDIVDSGYLETLGFTPQQAASKFYRASRCSECYEGYRGRFAIFEVMPISKRMEQLMLESAPASELRQQAEREGIKNLRQSGIDKIMEGRTSLEEVLRVTTE